MDTDAAPRSLRILVLTIVHHPQDARVLHRQIAALLERGHEVVYAAPFAATHSVRPEAVTAVDVPRAVGRARLVAWRAARATVRAHRSSVDLVLFHDPELTVALAGMRRPPAVWDVHEDTVATLVDKPWLPAWLRGLLAPVVHVAERLAERSYHVMLADAGYRGNFRFEHPVVPNETLVPDAVEAPGSERVVYLGRVSRGRGADVLVALADQLPPGVTLDVVGPADPDVETPLRAAHEAGQLRWRGFLPNDEALATIEGALAGLNLVRDLPNYRTSRQTKVFEYMARGVPVITTPVLPAARVVEENCCGLVVPFDDPIAVGTAVRALWESEQLRRELGGAGHSVARSRFDWRRSSRVFTAAIESWATPGTAR